MTIDFNKINSVAMSSIHSLLNIWLPGGVCQGNEYVACNPNRIDNKQGSFKFNIKTGLWSDFACGDEAKGGDAVSLYAYLNNVSQAKAARMLADKLGVTTTSVRRPRKKNSRGQQFTPVSPVPGNAPKPTFEHYKYGSASSIWAYRDDNGKVLFYVCRYDGTQGKEILPCSFCQDDNGNRAWRFKGHPPLRPLYGLELLAVAPADTPLLLVEGEKAAEAARSFLQDDMVVMTWPNGSKAIKQVDWSPLEGRTVIMWPDADEPGFRAALDIANMAISHKASAYNIVSPPADVPKGWDLADASDWSGGMVLAWINENKMDLDSFKADAEARYGIEGQPDATSADPLPEFIVNDEGVYHQTLNRDGEIEKKWVCSTLGILAETRDENNENWGVWLEVIDPDGNTHKWAMANELAAGDGREYRAYLAKLGLKIGHGTKCRSLLLKYITLTESGRRALCVAQTGWNGELFVLHKQTFGPTNGVEVIWQGSYVEDPYRCKGSLEAWRDSVGRLAFGNTRLQFGISAALTGPLLRVMGAESGGAHLVGASSIGKTTILRASGSVCGDPSTYIKTWRATDNGFEGLAAAHKDGFLLLDEMGQCHGKTIDKVVYMLANGVGKARANQYGGDVPVKHWELMCLSSGELSLEAKLEEDGIKSKAGQTVRFVDIPADAGKGFGAFEDLHGLKDGDAFATAIRRASGECYGTPLRAFLSEITKDTDKVHSRVAGYVVSAIDAMLPDEADGQVKRVCKRMALVAAAGEYAVELEILPWNPGDATSAAAACFAAWLENRGGTESDEVYKAIRQVRAYIEKHGGSRFQLKGETTLGKSYEPAVDVRDRVGFKKQVGYGDSAEYEYYALGEAFRNEICKGFDHKMVCRELIKRGMMRKQSTGFQVAENLPGMGLKKVYCLTSDVLNA
jgi:uncharacterized protein (DUF927 family)